MKPSMKGIGSRPQMLALSTEFTHRYVAIDPDGGSYLLVPSDLLKK